MSDKFHEIVTKHKIRILAWYVDDILVIFDDVTTNKDDILDDLNNMYNKIKFKQEKEIKNTVNYLDITIEKI